MEAMDPFAMDYQDEDDQDSGAPAPYMQPAAARAQPQVQQAQNNLGAALAAATTTAPWRSGAGAVAGYPPLSASAVSGVPGLEPPGSKQPASKQGATVEFEGGTYDLQGEGSDDIGMDLDGDDDIRFAPQVRAMRGYNGLRGWQGAVCDTAHKWPTSAQKCRSRH